MNEQSKTKPEIEEKSYKVEDFLNFGLPDAIEDDDETPITHSSMLELRVSILEQTVDALAKGQNIDNVEFGESVSSSTVATKPKKKKALSSWNCYLRKCTKDKNGKDFKACMKDKVLKAKDYEKNKSKYQKMAKEGCNI